MSHSRPINSTFSANYIKWPTQVSKYIDNYIAYTDILCIWCSLDGIPVAFACRELLLTWPFGRSPVSGCLHLSFIGNPDILRGGSAGYSLTLNIRPVSTQIQLKTKNLILDAIEWWISQSSSTKKKKTVPSLKRKYQIGNNHTRHSYANLRNMRVCCLGLWYATNWALQSRVRFQLQPQLR